MLPSFTSRAAFIALALDLLGGVAFAADWPDISFQQQASQADATVEASIDKVQVLVNQYQVVVTHITCKLVEQYDGTVGVPDEFVLIMPGGDYLGDVHYMNGFPTPSVDDVFIATIDHGEDEFFAFHNGPSSLLIQGVESAQSSMASGTLEASTSGAPLPASAVGQERVLTSRGFPVVSMPCGGPIRFARDPATLPVVLELREDNLTPFGTPVVPVDNDHVRYTATPWSGAMSWAQGRAAMRSCAAQRRALGGAP